jgi:type I restriction enzyme S subunit
VIHPGERTGEATFVGLEHIEANSGRRVGSQTIDLGTLTGRKPTFRRGQIVYGYLRPYLNKVWIAEFDGYSSVDQFAFDVRSELADTEFVAAFMRSDTFLRRSSIVTTTGQLPRIGTEQIAAVPIELPPIDVQRTITAALARQLAAADDASRAAAERVAAATSLGPAFYRQSFGDAPPLSAAPITPDTPTRPGWRWRRLTDVARLATGHTPSRRFPEYWDGNIPWLQLPDIRALDGQRAFDTSEHINQRGIENSAAVLLPEGTVCLSRTASVGFVTIMGREMATSQDFVNWVCGPEIHPEFLMHLLIASRRIVHDLGSGAVHHTIYFPTVEAFSICAPSINEQRSICADLAQRLKAAGTLVAMCRDESRGIDSLPAASLRSVFVEDS